MWQSEFRALLICLGAYATLYEVFLGIDSGDDDATGAGADDQRLSRKEWSRALPQIREAGSTWAESIVLANASMHDFDKMDPKETGFVDLVQFVSWIKATEKKLAAKRRGAKQQPDPILSWNS